MNPEEYTETEWLGMVHHAPLLPFSFGAWGDLLDPNVIHDYVWTGDDE